MYATVLHTMYEMADDSQSQHKVIFEFEILQKVCVQLKICELVIQHCQQSSSHRSVRLLETLSPSVWGGHSPVSSLQQQLPW